MIKKVYVIEIDQHFLKNSVFGDKQNNYSLVKDMSEATEFFSVEQAKKEANEAIKNKVINRLKRNDIILRGLEIKHYLFDEQLLFNDKKTDIIIETKAHIFAYDEKSTLHLYEGKTLVVVQPNKECPDLIVWESVINKNDIEHLLVKEE